MFNVCIKTIPHSKQRYDTVGDWWFDPTTRTLEIRVSDLGSWTREALVAVHELIEAACCDHNGISEESVTRFDEDFERHRLAGDTGEPGDAPGAPYREEHFFATTIERLLAKELDVEWQSYERGINAL